VAPRLGSAALRVGACVLAAAAGPLSAQSIAGVVLEEASRLPLREVRLTAIDAQGRERGSAVTDSLGLFQIGALGQGTFTLRAERVGAGAVNTAPVVLGAGERVELEIRLAAEAIPLQPVIVQARRRLPGRLTEYYDRLDWNRRAGIGRFVTREDIDRQARPNVLQHLQQVPSLRVTGSPSNLEISMLAVGGRCTPAVLLDGIPISPTEVNTMLAPQQLEGIEVYRELDTPMQYRRANCGTVLLWTRREGRRTLTLTRLLVGGAAVVAVLLFAASTR
jgi:hypothetical protein